MASKVLGLMDVAAGVKYSYSSSKEKILVDGWGDESTNPQDLLERIKTSGIEEFGEIQMDFTPDEHESSTETVKVSRGSFNSPMANEYIHEENKVGYVELVEPRESQLKGCVVLLPMTGDLGFSYRRNMLAIPLAKEGYAVVSLIIPYYGKRIPEGQNQHYIRTVYEYALSGVGAFVEGALLIDWMCKHFGEDIPVAIGGLSYGGIMSIGSAALTKRNVVAVPCLATTNAGGILSGMLKGIVKLPKEFSKEERKKVYEYMSKQLNLEDIVVNMSGKDFMKGKKLLVHQVSAKNDWIVIQKDGDVLEELMKKHATAYTRSFVPGGHVFGIANGKKLFVPEFLKAFEEYETLTNDQN